MSCASQLFVKTVGLSRRLEPQQLFEPARIVDATHRQSASALRAVVCLRLNHFLFS
jgi:hypothetical protein